MKDYSCERGNGNVPLSVFVKLTIQSAFGWPLIELKGVRGKIINAGAPRALQQKGAL